MRRLELAPIALGLVVSLILTVGASIALAAPAARGGHAITVPKTKKAPPPHQWEQGVSSIIAPDCSPGLSC